MAHDGVTVIERGEGEQWTAGIPITCKVRSEETRGAFAVLELVLPPGTGPGLHVHHREDEMLYILGGECTVGSPASTWRATAGSTVVFHKGAAHFFRNEGAEPCRLLIVAIPGGLDCYFDEINAALEAGEEGRIPDINHAYEIDFTPPGSPLPQE